MKYAKLKHDIPTHFFMVDEEYKGISVFIHGDSASISTYHNGAKWFGEMYESCTESEFNAAKAVAQHKINTFCTEKNE